jgi:hypothetical protein
LFKQKKSDHACKEWSLHGEKLVAVVENVSGDWKDQYRPFGIVKLSVFGDFFGKGNVE